VKDVEKRAVRPMYDPEQGLKEK